MGGAHYFAGKSRVSVLGVSWIFSLSVVVVVLVNTAGTAGAFVTVTTYSPDGAPSNREYVVIWNRPTASV